MEVFAIHLHCIVLTLLSCFGASHTAVAHRECDPFTSDSENLAMGQVVLSSTIAVLISALLLGHSTTMLERIVADDQSLIGHSWTTIGHECKANADC